MRHKIYIYKEEGDKMENKMFIIRIYMTKEMMKSTP